MLYGGDDGTARIIDLEAKKGIYRREYRVPIVAGAPAPDGIQGAVCDVRGRVYRFELAPTAGIEP